jgi:hypothetical protein
MCPIEFPQRDIGNTAGYVKSTINAEQRENARFPAMKCYLFDIDGTIADLSHRLRFIEKKPKDWRRFFEAVSKDTPITHIIELANHLKAAGLDSFMSPGEAPNAGRKHLLG